MNHSSKGALAAAGVLLVACAGTFATMALGPAAGVFNVGKQWPNVIVALGLIGYTAAVLVAAFGKSRPRHARG
jgi:hypothetical protein